MGRDHMKDLSINGRMDLQEIQDQPTKHCRAKMNPSIGRKKKQRVKTSM
jgi:hypothetical protein